LTLQAIAVENNYSFTMKLHIYDIVLVCVYLNYGFQIYFQWNQFRV